MRTDLDRATEDAALNAALAEHVAKLIMPGEGDRPIYPDYVNDPKAVLELLEAEPAGWHADMRPDDLRLTPGVRWTRYGVSIGPYRDRFAARGFGPTFHRAAIRALLRAHGVAGIFDRD